MIFYSDRGGNAITDRTGGWTIFGEHEDKVLAQLKRCMEPYSPAVLCADAHFGYSMPVGGVVAYRRNISPSGVGYDIGCGNKAVRTDKKVGDFDVAAVMDVIKRVISFGMGLHNNERVNHPILGEISTSHLAPLFMERPPQIGKHPRLSLLERAEKQLGTVGGGNHYIDLLADADDAVWIGVHFGSRGFGHGIASGFLALNQGAGFIERVGEGEMESPPVLFDAGSVLGQDYLHGMELAGKYAYAGRDWVVSRVLRILGATATFEVHQNHNYCLPGDAIIATPCGPLRMNQVGVGDIVYAVDLKSGAVESRVLNVVHSGRKPIYRIHTRNRELRCSGDHPVLTVDVSSGPHPLRPWHPKRAGSLVWKRVEEIRRGDIVVCAREFQGGNVRIAQDEARLIGAYLGDGWTRSDPVPQHTVGLAIGGRKDKHTERYLRMVRRLFPGVRWFNNVPGAFGLTCSSKTVRNWVIRRGLVAPSTLRRVPREIFGLTVDLRREVLAGYIDADGSVADRRTSNHGRTALRAANRELIEDLWMLAVGLGLRSTPIRSWVAKTNYGPCAVSGFNLDAASTATLDLWSARKRGNRRQSGGFRSEGLQAEKIGYIRLPEGTFAQRIDHVTVETDQETYDLSVEHHDHAFIADGVVVHNCWRESHFGEDYWVVRKGATPAFPGQQGFVGGSMGDISVILEGVESERSQRALYSTVHGAGRVMSRTEAKGKFKKGKRVKEGRVNWDAWNRKLKADGIVIRGGDADEAPECYRPLESVLRHHEGTIRVLHVLRPLGVAMAGYGDGHDPYKD